tara:strand:- start:1188 stop:2723 length:1536 start_codon:yes stop_codon:yes gene_type:complete
MKKTYKNFMTESAEHIIALLLEKDIRNINAPELAPLLRILKQAPQETIDRAYEAVFVPNMEMRIGELFDNRKMTTGKVEVAKEALMSKIIKINVKVEEKLDFINKLIGGKLVDADAIVTDALKGEGTNIGNKKYIKDSNPLINNPAFYNWFVSWEPQIDKRNMGGGEIFLILNHPSGRKGKDGKGDVYFEGGVAGTPGVIELKKGGKDLESDDPEAKKGSGAAFGKKDGFRDGKKVFDDFWKKTTGATEVPGNVGLGVVDKSSGGGVIKKEKFSAAMNEASIRLYEHGASVTQITDMWKKVCTACQGGMDGGIKFNDAIYLDKKMCVTEPNTFMHIWVANGMNVYAKKESHDVIFYYNPANLNAYAFKTGQDYLSVAGKVDIDYDWALDWKQGGYGNFVPRLKVEPYTPAKLVKGESGYGDILGDVFANALMNDKWTKGAAIKKYNKATDKNNTLKNTIDSYLREKEPLEKKKGRAPRDNRSFSDFMNIISGKKNVGNRLELANIIKKHLS